MNVFKKIVYTGLLTCMVAVIASCAYDNAEELYGQGECGPEGEGTSFSMSIAPIIEANCAVSGCHINGQQPPALLTYQQIASQANKIQFRTSNGTMPPSSSGLTLSQTEINKIACWVDSGAPEN